LNDLEFRPRNTGEPHGDQAQNTPLFPLPPGFVTNPTLAFRETAIHPEPPFVRRRAVAAPMT
jgi:hypothetical protein